MAWCCCTDKTSGDVIVDKTVDDAIKGNPRNKTALKPGHSLMDWIRLGHSGQDLTGVNGVSRMVTLEELAQHNQETDCWLAIRGIVYNVTHYMEFHPGGPYQLMKGAGVDATEMFDEVHAYVNYSSILQKCVVGRLRSSITPRVSEREELDSESDTIIQFKLPTQVSHQSIKTLLIDESQPATTVLLPLDWYQKENSINLIFYTKIPNPGVEVRLNDRDISVQIKLNTRVILSTFTLLKDVRWPCTVQINDIGKVEIEFIKVENCQWNTYGTPCEGRVVKLSGEEKTQLRVVETLPVTYNTKLIVLRYDEKRYNVVPIGHHLLVHFDTEGRTGCKKCRCPKTPSFLKDSLLEKMVRMYTPVPPHLHSDFSLAKWTPDSVCLMVKEYNTGAVSPRICALKPGDLITVSGPEGLFKTQMVKDCTHLYMIAAGTGITPMMGLTQWVLEGKKKKCKSVNLMFFNRTSEDILWYEQMDRLAKSDDRFSVTHVLSQPNDSWTGARGHVDTKLLTNFLPKSTAEASTEDQDFITICGPTLFTQITRKLIEELGFPHNKIHCFVG